MTYLFDANNLIQAKNEYYPLEYIPQYWEWLVDQGELGNIKIPFEIYDEISAGSDDLSSWIKEAHVKDALLLEETVDPGLLQNVMETGYQSLDPKFTETDIESIGRDAFLVAYACAEDNRVVVTKEKSKPSLKRGNRKVPDVCNDMKISWTRDFEVYRDLGFSLAGK